MLILDQINEIIRKGITNKEGYKIVRLGINSRYAFKYVSSGYHIKLFDPNLNSVVIAEFISMDDMVEWLNEKGWEIK